MEEFESWSKAQAQSDEQARLTDERGGPRLTLVPENEQEEAWPTDLLPPPLPTPTPAPAADPAGDSSSAQPSAPTPLDGVALPESRNRLAGWSAERQRVFLETLAETGSVHLASSAARLSARSAYRLRTRSPAFAAAWDSALQLSVGRLSAIVFDRAINGRIEQLFEDGVLVGERRVPSDRLLTWLLARLDPRRFALPWEHRGDADPQAAAVAAFPAQLDALTDLSS
jgi:hypothetical protein